MSQVQVCTESEVQIYQVQIIQITDAGLNVKVCQSGEVGFIKWRDVSWERRITQAIDIPKIGDVVQAVLIEKSDGLLGLSIKDCIDPWGNLEAKDFPLESIVTGEVVNVVTDIGAFVQLRPGIDALVRPSEVPLGENDSTIEEILFVGDKVRGMITKNDLKNHKIEISINKFLKKLDVITNRLSETDYEDIGLQEISQSMTNQQCREIIYNPQNKIIDLKKILVVDDEPEILIDICEKLRESFSVPVLGASTKESALQEFNNNWDIGIVIIDLHLGEGEHGANLAEEILDIRMDIPIIFMSSVPFEDRGDYLYGYDFPFCLKDITEITQTIEQLQTGFWEEYKAYEFSSQHLAREDQFIQQLGIAAFTKNPLIENVQRILGALQAELLTSNCILVRLESSNRQVFVVASIPALDTENISSSDLYRTPIRNVIENRKELLDNEIAETQLTEGKYRYLFPAIPFLSAYLVPIVIPDYETEYALIILDEDPASFLSLSDIGQHHQQLVQNAARNLSLAIEREHMFESMRRYEEMYSQGQLLADMVHETNNRLSSLEIHIKRLNNLFSQDIHHMKTASLDSWAKKGQNAVKRITDIEDDIHVLVKAYHRLASSQLHMVDINEIVNLAIVQLRQFAKRHHVIIKPDLTLGLPPVLGVPSQIQQVVLNLMLNAIQQIAKQSERMEKLASKKRRSWPSAILQSGYILVQTKYDEPKHLIEIKVIDSGPGVHHRYTGKIFSRGFSMRSDGAGLGLSISRNIIERLGGTLDLTASIIFVGSVFTVQLPIAEEILEG